MKEYYKVISVYIEELNEYLEKGWEIVETEKSREPHAESVRYHIGFPLSKAFEDAKKLLNKYEEHGFRSQLLETEAKQLGEDVTQYRTFSGKKVKNSLVDLLEKIDFIIEGENNPKYFKKYNEVEYVFNGEELDF